MNCKVIAWNTSYQNVVSGVPQGTALGPTLFLLFINDIVDRSDSTILLFADDTVVYRELASPSDHACLQYDLRNPESWAKTWQMQFNIAKCQLLSISNKKNTSKFDYTLDSQYLTPTDEHDSRGGGGGYLGQILLGMCRCPLRTPTPL